MLRREHAALVADLFGFNEFVFSKTLEETVSAEQWRVLRQMVDTDDSLEMHMSRWFLNRKNAVEYASWLRDQVVPELLTECIRIVDEIPATRCKLPCAR